MRLAATGHGPAIVSNRRFKLCAKRRLAQLWLGHRSPLPAPRPALASEQGIREAGRDRHTQLFNFQWLAISTGARFVAFPLGFGHRLFIDRLFFEQTSMDFAEMAGARAPLLVPQSGEAQ